MSAMRRVGDVMAGMGNPQPHGARDPYAGGVMTKQGWFSDQDIRAAGGLTTEDQYGRRIVQFRTWSRELGMHYRVVPAHQLEEGGRR
jgi:hypothetical protein